MRKLITKRLVFRLVLMIGIVALPIFTFAVGTVATVLWQEFGNPPTVSLCQLTRNPWFYAWRTVRVEAAAEGRFGAVFITDETCDLTDGSVAASGVWKAEGYDPSAETQKLFTEADSETFKARIVVTGRFDPQATRGCWTPKFAIHATSVELKSEIETEVRERQNE